MAIFELLHVVAGLVGLGAAVGLVGPWTEWTWQFSAAMWAAALAVIGSGIPLSLSTVGTGTEVASGLLLGKVVLTVVLLALMYATLFGSDDENPPESKPRLLGMVTLWVVVFGMGVGTVL